MDKNTEMVETSGEGMLAGNETHGDVPAGQLVQRGQSQEEEQQILHDPQLEIMDVEGEGDGEALTTGTTSSTDQVRDGSYGSGKVQTNLQGWLKL